MTIKTEKAIVKGIEEIKDFFENTFIGAIINGVIQGTVISLLYYGVLYVISILVAIIENKVYEN